jgi:DNA ligase (NAD+)
MRGIGKGVLADLLLNKIITNHADLFKLDTDQQKQNIMRALGYTEYGIRRIINIVDESRLISLRKFIVALGISDVSIGVAAHLAEHYKSIDRLREIETSEIDPISGINKKTLIGINEFFSCDDSKIIDTYLESGVIVIDDESTKPRFRILITGTLSSVRSEIEERIKKAGCTLAKTISRHVDFIVVGESPSKTKIEAANRLNIKMINEQQLLSILKGV